MLSAGSKSVFRLLSPAGRFGRLSIFIFHRVLEQADPLLPDEPDARQFEKISAFLSRSFSVIPLDEAAERLQSGSLPAAAACITFDDGYRDNLNVAAPILRKHGLHATLFVATGYLDGGCMWNDIVIEAMRCAPDGCLDLGDLGLNAYALSDTPSRVDAYRQLLPRLKHLDGALRSDKAYEIAHRAGLKSLPDLMLRASDLRRLMDQDWEIGGHTVSHPILARLEDSAAYREISLGREQLAAITGRAPSTFAYPNGIPGFDFGTRDVALARRAGFKVAVTTAAASNFRGSDLLQLSRFTPWDREMSRFGARCAMNLFRRGRPLELPSGPHP